MAKFRKLPPRHKRAPLAITSEIGATVKAILSCFSRQSFLCIRSLLDRDPLAYRQGRALAPTPTSGRKL